MKLIQSLHVATIFILTTFSLFGQQSSVTETNFNALSSISNAGAPNTIGTASGSSSMFSSSPTNVEGSYYVFENWENNAVIELNNGKKYVLEQNFNINAYKGSFESKISEESVYIFELGDIKKVNINYNPYVVKYFKKENKFVLFQELGNYNGKTLLKDFKAELIQRGSDPYRGNLNDQIVINSNYYISQNDEIIKIKLKKSSIINQFDNESNAVKTFMKDEKLSFKEDNDLRKLFRFLNNS
ncbi:hypothetical protein [Dokdonia sp. Asnod3-C12]|uniref:hypothetical protein n=1 Tax=Dokdonia sp. Asnod3-C12 TaxID=3160575 RepID=UPI003865C133